MVGRLSLRQTRSSVQGTYQGSLKVVKEIKVNCDHIGPPRGEYKRTRGSAVQTRLIKRVQKIGTLDDSENFRFTSKLKRCLGRKAGWGAEAHHWI